MADGAPLQLAEVRWTWRRVFSIGLTVALLGLLVLVITRLSDPGALKAIALALAALIGLVALLYIAGATTTDVARLVAAARAAPTPGDPQ
jgi:hypothetical protein